MKVIALTENREFVPQPHLALRSSTPRSRKPTCCPRGGLPFDRRLGSWVARLAILHLLLSLTGCAGLFSPRPVLTDQLVLPSEETDVVGKLQVVYVHDKDTLADFARNYGLGYDEIVDANPGVNAWRPGEGTKVILPTEYVLPDAPREGVVINLASLRLFYYPKPEGDRPQVVITHPVGIGREGFRTPQGKFRITQKIENPAWRPTASVRREHAAMGDPLPPIVPAGPKNPLGTYAMLLNRPRYLIHGTNKPYGVGMRVSHGCIRLYPEDIAGLYPDVPVGTPVRIVNQPYLAGWRDGQLYLEAQQPLSEEAKRWKGSLEPMEKVVMKKAGDRQDAVDWDRAQKVAQAGLGIPFSISKDGGGIGKLLAKVDPWSSASRASARP
jgi:L,D-transpeptidase ErfK/SrfK